ncbi:MAG: PilN domain-containing protein [Cellvibrionaceae bacterium]
MAMINLRPWREELREEKKKEFVVILGAVVAFAFILVFVWMSLINSQIDSQKSRNRLLETELTQLHKQVKEIRELRKKREELIDRMKVIQDLQGKRPAIVHVFDEFVRAMPDGVFLGELERSGKTLKFKGTAESNQRVSALMRNLNKSEWFTAPNLTKVEAGGELGDHSSQFDMTVRITDPKDAKKDDEAA